MSAVLRRLRTGARVLVTRRDECDHKIAPFGFMPAGHRSRWYCMAHRHIGDAWLAELEQARQRATALPAEPAATVPQATLL